MESLGGINKKDIASSPKSRDRCSVSLSVDWILRGGSHVYLLSIASGDYRANEGVSSGPLLDDLDSRIIGALWGQCAKNRSIPPKTRDGNAVNQEKAYRLKADRACIAL